MTDRSSLERFFCEKIYLTPSQASEEIFRRRNNPELLQKVRDYLKDELPACFQVAPKAILARVLASPNFEFFEFQKLARMANLEGWCLEYTHDKFRAENFDKYYLGKLCFNHGIGKKGGEKISTFKTIDFNQAEGKNIHTVTTLWDEGFVDFHHRILSMSTLKHANFEDASEWIIKKGKKSKVFYPYYLSLFICHGVLFENFLLEDKPLIEEMFMPALKIVYEKFGFYPLIVPLSPIEREYDLYWKQYPAEVEIVTKMKM
jgi:hypothetical protein